LIRVEVIPSRSFAATITLALATAVAVSAQTERSSFSVRFKQEVTPYPVFGIFVLPGDRVPLEVLPTHSTDSYITQAFGGVLERIDSHRWSWTAPEGKGLYPILVRDSLSGETVTLNAFVMLPAPAEATLNGFTIGSYERRPLRGDSAYRRPDGFVEVTEVNRGALVSPHFSLGQFVSKQPGGFPKYLVLRERLLLKLEILLEEARKAGMRLTTFRIMSGYRTPSYNRSIGNETRYSRHVYGDAADIYVDEDGDGSMDDLDGDGRVTLDDARALAGVVDSLAGLEGGLGLYGATAEHGPFVHVDVRGHRVTWGFSGESP
jgi:peptidase M15-like protein